MDDMISKSVEEIQTDLMFDGRFNSLKPNLAGLAASAAAATLLRSFGDYAYDEDLFRGQIEEVIEALKHFGAEVNYHSDELFNPDNRIPSDATVLALRAVM